MKNNKIIYNISNLDMFKTCAIGALIIISGASNAGEIFKCTNKNSEVYYNDKPCPVNDVESKFKSVKDPTNGYIPPSFVESEIKNNAKGVVVGSGSKRNVDKDKTEESSSEDLETTSDNKNNQGGGSAGASSDSTGSSNQDSAAEDGLVKANTELVKTSKGKSSKISVTVIEPYNRAE